MKKKVSFTEQHEWIRVASWFNNFTIKVGLTVSFSGKTCNLAHDPKYDAMFANGDISKRVLRAFSKFTDSKQGGNLGQKMKSLKVMAEQEEDFLTFLKKLEAA